jgi:ERCC4-type nuclease
MLILDDRERDIIPIIKTLNIDSSVSRMEFADCLFEGHGESGECLVAIERKRWSDLINSIRDRRLAGHQLKGIQKAYENVYIFLFIEASFRPGSHDSVELEVRPGIWRQVESRGGQPVTYKGVSNFITGLELRGGVFIRRTRDAYETAAEYAALYSNFNDKLWHQHHSHDAVYIPDPEVSPTRRGRPRFNVRDISQCYKFAATLPGIDARAEEVAAFFNDSPTKMVLSKADEWTRIKGIGKTIAERAVTAMQGKDRKLVEDFWRYLDSMTDRPNGLPKTSLEYKPVRHKK